MPEQASQRINTVMVVECKRADVFDATVTTFHDNPEGQKQARELFTSIVKETTELTDAQIEDVLYTDGFVDLGEGFIAYVTSN